MRTFDSMPYPGSEDKTPLVSVIMPNFNGARWLEHSIRSVIEQSYRNWELIVADDGSTDESFDVIKGFSDSDERISLLALPDNSGNPGVARNSALRVSRGQYVAFLDSDDLWHPSKLVKQVSLMDASGPETALCHHDMTKSVIGGGYLNGTTFSESPVRGVVEGRCFDALILRNFIPTSSVMLRRYVLLERQFWFDTRHRTCQDWDLWLRIAWNYSFAYVPEVLGVYRIHGGNVTTNRRAMKREDKAILKKWRGKAQTGLYAKAMAGRYMFDIYDTLPWPMKVAIRRVMS